MRVCDRCGKLRKHYAKGFCKHCHKYWLYHNSPKYRENLLLTNRKHSKKWRINNPEKYIQIQKEYRAKHPEIFRHHNKIWRENNPKKIKAQHIAQYRLGKAKGNCIICGSNKNLVRHHPDYSKPLEVMILCRKCHYKTFKTT